MFFDGSFCAVHGSVPNLRLRMKQDLVLARKSRVFGDPVTKSYEIRID